MQPIQRSEILDYVTYEEQRSELRPQVLEAKKSRRMHLGEHLTFLFENRETVRYQIQEMMRVEKIVKEKDILHEIETYNELVGGEGQLGCTLLIEIDDPEARAELLVKWLDLPKHLYLITESGQKVSPRYDERQVGETRVSSVQYLMFDCQGSPPVKLGCDHPDYTHEVELTDSQTEALKQDLGS